MQLSLSSTTPVTPRSLNRAKSREAIEGTFRAGCKILGRKTACRVAEMPDQLAMSAGEGLRFFQRSRQDAV